MKSQIDLTFERDVPEHLQDDVMQRICEAAWGAQTVGVTIIDCEKRDVLNLEASGTIIIEGVERWFHIRDGNNSGTELIGWEESGVGIQREHAEAKTLVPFPGAVDHAIFQGRAAAFLEEWDNDLDPLTGRGARLSRLPAAAAYDAFFAPGSLASRTHHETAMEAGYTIDEASEAARMRSRLISASMTFAPYRERIIESRSTEQSGSETLRLWEEALDQGNATGARLRGLLDSVIARLAADPSRNRFPTSEEHGSFAAEGYVLCSVATARRLREELLKPLLSLEPVDGFDPAELPENPFLELLHGLDPSLVRSTKVNPQGEGERLLDTVARRLAREPGLVVSEAEQAAAARIGFRIHKACHEAPEEEPAGLEI